MLRQNFYITQSGKIRKKNNTVWFENEAIKKAIPVNTIDSIYCLGEVTINSKLLVFLAKQGIIIHFFNYYGYYSGTFYPKETLVSGSLIVNQVEHYKDSSKRLFLARNFVVGTIQNLVRILEHYRKHSKEVSNVMERMNNFCSDLKGCKSIPSVSLNKCPLIGLIFELKAANKLCVFSDFSIRTFTTVSLVQISP